MRYLGGGIGHHTMAIDPASNEIPVTEGAPASDSEMSLDEATDEDANQMQGPQIDDIENPNEDDYEHDDASGKCHVCFFCAFCTFIAFFSGKK